MADVVVTDVVPGDFRDGARAPAREVEVHREARGARLVRHAAKLRYCHAKRGTGRNSDKRRVLTFGVYHVHEAAFWRARMSHAVLPASQLQRHITSPP
jgi:hypothetical protein